MKKRPIHKPYNKFKIWLKDRKITYSGIAELLGITPTSVMLKINGQSDFTLSEVRVIEIKYGINNEIFFTDDFA